MITQTHPVQSWKYAGILPLLAGMICVFSFCSSPGNTSGFAEPQYVMDTVIVFNPETYEETITIVRRPVSEANATQAAPVKLGEANVNDTRKVYDPQTQEKTTRVSVTRVKKQ